MQPVFRFGSVVALTLRRSLGLLASCLILGCVLSCVSEVAAATPQLQTQDAPADAEQALFIRGQNLHNQNLFHEAIAVFDDFLKAYPQSQIKDLALLWLGRCHIRVGDVGAAEQIALRLREIPETQFVSLYEEELRVARQTYVSAAMEPAKPASIEVPLATTSPLMSAPAVAKTPGPDPNPTSANVKVTSSAFRPAVAKEVAKAGSIIVRTPPPLAPAKAITSLYEPAEKLSEQGPLIRVRVEQSPRETAFGAVTFYRLVLVNEGKSIARDLLVSELLIDDAQFASSDPAPTSQEPVGRSQRLTFRIAELKAGASRTFRVAVRLRTGAAPESVLKTKHSVSYQDSEKRNYVTY